MSVCIDCGTTVSEGSLRCRKDNGAYRALLDAREASEADADLLRMRDVEGLSEARIGVRLGVSRQIAHVRLKNARRRQALLQKVAGG